MTDYNDYTTAGLTASLNQLGSNLNKQFTYPEYVSSATNSPTKESYYTYTPTTPLAQIQSPNYQLSAGSYQSLLGGDYDKLQTALTTPGEISAKTAYNQGYNNLNSTMGGQGLYGSSIMQNQATTNLDSVYQNALATNAANAAASRYELEQAGLIDLNKYNLTREDQLNEYGTNKYKLDQSQALNTYNANASEAARKMAYGEGLMNWDQDYADKLTEWKNNQLYDKYVYDLTKNDASNAYDLSKLNQALALASGGSSLVSSQNTANSATTSSLIQKLIADQKADTDTTTGWMNLASTSGGGLLQALLGSGTSSSSGLLDSLYDSIWDMSSLAL